MLEQTDFEWKQIWKKGKASIPFNVTPNAFAKYVADFVDFAKVKNK